MKFIQKQRLEVFYKKGIRKNFAKFTGKQLRLSLEVFYKKGIRKNFAKFTGKQLRLSLKRPWHRCFLVNFGKILRTPSYEKPLSNCFCPF